MSAVSKVMGSSHSHSYFWLPSIHPPESKGPKLGLKCGGKRNWQLDLTFP